MFYIRWETPSQKPRAWKLRNWKWLWLWYNFLFRCKPACAPLFSCAHSIVKLHAMVIHVRVYARRLTIHIHFTQAQPCRNYGNMPRSWPYTELRNGKKRGIDQSETSSHLTHLIYSGIPLIAMQYNINIHQSYKKCIFLTPYIRKQPQTSLASL